LINETSQNTPSEADINQDSSINYNGSWEKKNRSITAAAFTGLIVIGAIYFNVQSIIMTVFISIYKAVYNIEFHGDFFEKVKQATVFFRTPILVTVMFTEFVFMLIPALWIVKKWHTTNVRKYIRIRLCSLNEVLLAVLITIFSLPFCYYISELLVRSLNIPKVFRELGSQLFAAKTGGQFIFLIFAIAVTPAICEEVFFRGYFQRTMERKIGAKSFILTGILFGLFHMQPLGLITLSILGILFSFFYYRSKSIFPSSAAHFTNNFIAISLMYIQTNQAKIGIFLSGEIPLSIVIISLLITLSLVWLFINITRQNFAY
jgi:uncharacterized protein